MIIDSSWVLMAALGLLFFIAVTTVWSWLKSPLSEYYEVLSEGWDYLSRLVADKVDAVVKLPIVWMVFGIMTLIMGVYGLWHLSTGIPAILLKLMSPIKNHASANSLASTLFYLVIGIPAMLVVLMKMPGNFLQNILKLPPDLNNASNRAILDKLKSKSKDEILKILKALEKEGLASQENFHSLLDHPDLAMLLALLGLAAQSGTPLSPEIISNLLGKKDKEHFHDKARSLAKLMKKKVKAEFITKFLKAQKEGKALACADALLKLQAANAHLVSTQNIATLASSAHPEQAEKALAILATADPRCDSQKNFEAVVSAGKDGESAAKELVLKSGSYHSQIFGEIRGSKKSILNMDLNSSPQNTPNKKI